MKKGQQFTYNGQVFTALAFFGRSGVLYDTEKLARQNNREGIITVLVDENTGACIDITHCKPL